jgi:antitoxin (DNA-binding transcriptional repressor) of toxin-antitoxin stability system
VEIPITQFRKSIFELVSQASDGQDIWLTHKGKRFKVVPEGISSNRLDRITPMELVNSEGSGLESVNLMEEMTKSWEEDWATL